LIWEVLSVGTAPYKTLYAADTAVLAGDVVLGDKVSVWHGAVLRGDISGIRVGEGSNIQDNVVLHAGRDFPIRVGNLVTVGHGAILHGCTVEDNCLIGMGSILMNGCVIGEGSLVAAGSLVTQGTVIPPRSLVMGSPARVVRELTQEEYLKNVESAKHYIVLAERELPAAKVKL